MDIERYKEFLLSSIPTAKIVSGGTHIACRCFYCPDGRSFNSKHFYISIPRSDDEPSMYYCHKCHASGVVTYKTLIDWNVFDANIADQLIDHNKKCEKYFNNKKYFSKQTYVVDNSITTDGDTTQYKLKYFNDRLGTNFTLDELRDMKVVLNLSDLFKTNQIQLTRDPRIVGELDKYFLGFMSIDNAFLNMRRTVDEGIVYKSIDKRYINYKIFDKYDSSERFYTIPTTIDMNIPNRIQVHIAEGPFDIVSIYENLRHREPGVYSSIAGSNYKGQIQYFLRLISSPFIDFHLYPDNDSSGSNSKMNYVAEFIKPTGCKLYIHRNLYEGEKDFGVPLSRIQEATMQFV